MAEITIGGITEEVITAEEFTLEKAREVLKDETIAVLGYGVQGPGQALNMLDNGFKVIIGQRESEPEYWDKAIKDGFVPGETLFSLEEAAQRGTIVMLLLSDAGQKAVWPVIEPYMTQGKALYFSHGFSIVYKEQTGVIPPKNIDVIMVAPKGSGLTVRRNFLDGSGINSSMAVFQDATGRAFDRACAIGIAIGSGYLFPTTFEQEVYSDLTGERGGTHRYRVLEPCAVQHQRDQDHRGSGDRYDREPGAGCDGHSPARTSRTAPHDSPRSSR